MHTLIFSSQESLNKMVEIIDFCQEHDLYLIYKELEIDFHKNEEVIYDRLSELELVVKNQNDEPDLIFEVNDYDDLSISLPYCDNSDDVKIIDFHNMITDAIKGTLSNKSVFRTDTTSYYLIKGDYYSFEQIPKLAYSINQKINDVTVTATIVNGLTPFALKLVVTGDYDEYYPPILNDDYFVYITISDKESFTLFDEVFEAYVFELNSTYSIEVSKEIRITELISDWNETLDKLTSTNRQLQMRPLMFGKGIQALLSLFNKALEITDSEFKILTFTKVIEYVSQSVLRKEMLESALIRLYSPKALNPDASYILELEQLFEEHRNNKKDNLALKLTVQTCCNIIELKDITPKFLSRFNNLKQDESNKDLHKSCLEELTTAITDTRNMIAHAKTNYKPKGKECPEDQLSEFADCLKIVAYQVIRWYERQHEGSRII